MDKLIFKWTVSRGRETYGYNICSLWVNGSKAFSTCGGGYDMKGTVFGEFIAANYQDELKKLVANYGSGDNTKGFYGLSFSNPDADGYERHNTYKEDYRVSLDGACGFSSMERIAKAIGYELTFIHGTKNKDIHLWSKIDD